MTITVTMGETTGRYEADETRGMVRPLDLDSAMLAGLGYSADDTVTREKQRAVRAAILDELPNEPWGWADQDGFACSPR